MVCGSYYWLVPVVTSEQFRLLPKLFRSNNFACFTYITQFYYTVFPGAEVTICYALMQYFVSHYECSRTGTKLGFGFYGSVFLMIVRLADDYFLPSSTLRLWHTTETMNVLPKADTGLKSLAKCYHIKQLKVS